MEQFDLTGKVALVSGCSRGIGMAMAVALAEAGADIIGVAATMEESGSNIEKAIHGVGRSFSGYSCDFSDRKALYSFIEDVKSKHPRIDILINNAGTIIINGGFTGNGPVTNMGGGLIEMNGLVRLNVFIH